MRDGIIGGNIRSFRLKNHLSQEEVSVKLQVMGMDMSRSTYSKIEAGIRHISVEELEAIRRILKMEYADFFSAKLKKTPHFLFLESMAFFKRCFTPQPLTLPLGHGLNWV